MQVSRGKYSSVANDKTKIKRWRAKKNIGADDVAQVVHSRCAEADLSDQQSTVVFQAPQMRWADMENQLKRNPEIVVKLDSGCMLEVQHVDGVTLRAPPVRLASVWPPLSPAAPFDEAIDERLHDEILRLTRDYCLGAMENGTWVSSEQGNFESSRGGVPAYQRLQHWSETMKLARHLIAKNELHKGFQLLNSALNKLASLFKDEDPSLLLQLVQLLFSFRSVQADLREILYRHFQGLAHAIWEQRHPLVLLLDRLVALMRLSPPYMTTMLPLQWMSDSLDPWYDTSIFYMNYVSGLWTPAPETIFHGDSILRQVVLNFQADSDPHRSTFYFNHLTEALNTMIERKRFKHADHIVDAIVHRISTTHERTHIKPLAEWFQRFNRARILGAMGQDDQAVSMASGLYHYSVNVYGPFHKLTLEALELYWESQTGDKRREINGKLHQDWKDIVEGLVNLELLSA